MNEVIRQLAARRSVRAFEDRDIPGEVRAAILEAAAQAPTAGNQQLYTILDVTDPQLKALANTLAAHHKKRYESLFNYLNGQQ